MSAFKLVKPAFALLLILAFSAIVPAASAESGAQTATIHKGSQFSPIVSQVLGKPTAVKSTDGRFHIAYELLLTNTAPLTMDVERIVVRNRQTRRVLDSVAGSKLDRNMNPVAGAGEPTTMGPSSTSVVWLDVAVKHASQLPRVLEHRLVASSQAPGPDFTYRGLAGRFPVARSKIVLGPPVRPGIWVANEGCCTNPTHHRRGMVGVDGELRVPQRHAIDWFRLDRDFNAWTGDPKRLSSYPSYRQPLIAAAAGRVVNTLDGVKQNQPQGTLPNLPPINETVGNHVTLRVAPGVFLLYAHMKPGSVRVKEGQKVRKGQVLGLLGNSGNSSTPHLHFEVMTRRTFFPTDSIPFAFEKFNFMGQIAEHFTDEDLALKPTGALVFKAAKSPGMRKRLMPLDNNVVRFGRSAKR